MAEEISGFTALTTPAAGDLLPIVDISDTTDAATGTTKKIAYSDLKFLQLDGTASMDGGVAIDFTNATGDVITNGTNSSKLYNVGANDGLALANGNFLVGVFSIGAIMGNFNTQMGCMGDDGIFYMTSDNWATTHKINWAGTTGSRTLDIPNASGTISVVMIPTAKAVNYTAVDREFILMTTGATDKTVTLPAATTNTGTIIEIKKIDSGAGNLILDGSGSETIDGATTQTLTTQYDFMRVQCDGTEWWIK